MKDNDILIVLIGMMFGVSLLVIIEIIYTLIILLS